MHLKSSLFTLIKSGVLLTVSLIMLLPLVWMVSVALSSPNDLAMSRWLPKSLSWQNLQISLNLITDPFTQKYFSLALWRVMFNSFFIAVWVTALQVFTSALAAYAFSRLQWRGRDVVFFLYVATMMLPSMVLVMAQFQIMVSLNLLNSYTGMIIPSAFSALGTFLLRQFMLRIPRSYDDAAQIDGAHHGQIFLQIILPLTKSGLLTLAIFTFLGNYQNLLWAILLIKDAHLQTVPLGLLAVQHHYGAQNGILMGATLICLLPPIIIFILFQKRLGQGVNLRSGVK